MKPDEIVFHAADIAARYAPRAWDFAQTRAQDIDAFWADACAANPTLYDGPALLAENVALAYADAEDKAPVLSMDFFATSFSRFLAWRRFGFPDKTVFNAFAMAALRSSDGAFLLGEMNPRHSSAGSLFFPAGTPDFDDVRGDAVDLAGSVLRELFEETGLAAPADWLSPGWTVIFEGPRIACMKLIDWPEPAAAILSRVRAYIAGEKEPELSNAHMFFRRAQCEDARVPSFMKTYLGELLPD